jgi:sugar O-acyltransferase (sialic acid O-acetyltransferase NeuD family)
MTQRVGIFGIGGMALETRDVAEAMGLEVLFIARDQAELLAFGGSGAEVVLESDIGALPRMGYAIAVGAGAVRRKIAARYAGTLEFVNLVHPSASFGHRQHEQVDSRQGVIVCAGARLTSDIVVGDFTIFNLNSTVHHGCVIGNFVTVSPLACVLGNVEVRDGAWIGAGAVVNQGTEKAKRLIGQNTVIGSGAVVTSDCEADAVYAGVPARKIK